MNVIQKATILDAIFAQRSPFSCITLMQYIAENEVSGKTIPHHEIAIYLDTLRERGFVKIVEHAEFTRYETVIP